MDHESSMGYVYFSLSRDFRLYCFSGQAEVPASNFGEGDNSTEVETKRQKRSGSAGITRCLVLLREVNQPKTTFRIESAVEPYWSRLSTMVFFN